MHAKLSMYEPLADHLSNIYHAVLAGEHARGKLDTITDKNTNRKAYSHSHNYRFCDGCIAACRRNGRCHTPVAWLLALHGYERRGKSVKKLGMCEQISVQQCTSDAARHAVALA